MKNLTLGPRASRELGALLGGSDESGTSREWAETSEIRELPADINAELWHASVLRPAS